MNCIDDIHSDLLLQKKQSFVEIGKPVKYIGRLLSGKMRGFVLDEEGHEVTTHFFQEGDMIIPSYYPNVSSELTIEALTMCSLSVAQYATVIEYMQLNQRIGEILKEAFIQIKRNEQNRLIGLLSLNASKRYHHFLLQYPSLINSIPHHHIASYLGITPTQLSRVRRDFVNKCKC